MFINIPRRYDPETLSQADASELIAAKIEKEANRYIHNWEDDKLSVQNARWGPIIKLGKTQFKLPRDKEGKRMTPEAAKELTIEQVKAIVMQQDPAAFEKTKPKKKKKAAPKKKKK